MRTLVMAMKAKIYKSRLTVEETMEWNRLVSEGILGQFGPFQPEEEVQWTCMKVEEELNSSTSIL